MTFLLSLSGRVAGSLPAARAYYLLLIGLAVVLSSCGKKEPAPVPATPEAAVSVHAATPPSPSPVSVPREMVTPAPVARRVPVSTKPAPAELWKEFNGDLAFAEVKQQVGIGPRPVASPELERARLHIISALEKNGWEVERQEFSDKTPRGTLKFGNIIARFSADGIRPVPQTTQRAIVCSHFDTKRFSTIKFVGANDGASSTGALLELSRVLALDPALAAKIELVFFDGEEALEQFSEIDGLYGSRFYAKALRDSNRNKQFVFGILWDMIGDSDLTITLSPDSPAELAKGILASAETVGQRQHFSFFDREIYDDHVPLNRVARIPTIDLIDFNFLWWHTADDTLERLHPQSLQKVGAVTVHYLQTRLR